MVPSDRAPRPFSALDTVPGETPARRATSLIVAEYGANYPKVSQAIWTAIQSAITGTSSVNSALQTAQGTISGVQLVSGG